MIYRYFVATLMFAASMANATIVTGKLVADDHYQVYVGDANGASLTQVATSGSNLWFSQGAAFTFNINPGEYIYITAWDDASFGPPHMWIGEFTYNGNTLLSNTTNWLGKSNNNIKDPTVAQVEALASSSDSWGALQVSMANGSSPYGTLLGGSLANMVWLDAFNGTSLSENGFAVFRTASPLIDTVSAVPLPSTIPLMLSGTSALFMMARRRKVTL